MSAPADLLTIGENTDPLDLFDALTLAVSHAKSSVQMVELELSDAANSGELLTSPALMATALHGTETHLAIIAALADRLATIAREADK